MIEKLQFMTLMFINDLKTPRRDDKGATAVEYGLLVALIAAVIIVAVSTLGGKINDAFGVINTNMK
ncbi:pilus assembly protein Flp/PilA [Nocardioides ginsengisegetis]|uniref:Pilus assembly protein Flp/PilA n=1 Tax=Nocardioides ginsengisegetis TaxID=661491 RepID=A0A7W3IYW2_9ACTN|nr:Flp family type IVb pilin [Nocardioides ginsengisegetis]MBA8803182.1 pilus assembly protein Flp/PilA [Nocardioides ginsengisegetis]